MLEEFAAQGVIPTIILQLGIVHKSCHIVGDVVRVNHCLPNPPQELDGTCGVMPQLPRRSVNDRRVEAESSAEFLYGPWLH